MNYRQRKKITDLVFELDEAQNPVEKYENTDPGSLSPLVLAYVGDAFYHLFVRKRLLSYARSHVEILHGFGAKIVSASWQARAFFAVEPDMTEEERGIFRRGRNAQSRTPNSATVKDYRISTGFEAVLGFLFLKGEENRLREISEAAFQATVREMTREDGNKVIERGRKL